jgi:hypothetical protein
VRVRTDWLPISASALVIGAMSLVLGALLNPITGSKDAAATMHIVEHADARWLGMAVMYFLASLALCLGLPAMLSLFVTRGRRLGLLAVGTFAIGTIGLSGYSMLMVFFRALVDKNLLKGRGLDEMTHDAGLSIFLNGWIAGFYLGVLFIAIALFVARKTGKWVPILLLVFVAMLPFVSHLGRVGMAIQVIALAVAFTGIATEAVSAEHKRDLEREPVF